MRPHTLLALASLWAGVAADSSKFTVRELMETKFRNKISNDIYLDPCKADGFISDIALPNEAYERELALQELALKSSSAAAAHNRTTHTPATPRPHRPRDPRRHRRKEAERKKRRRLHKKHKRRRGAKERGRGRGRGSKLRAGVGAAGRRALKRSRARGNLEYRRQLKARERRAATARKERVWDFGVIPYKIDSNFTGADKGLFKQAMRHWENYTCIRFVEKTEEHPNYIIFTERECGDSCLF